MIKTKVFRGVRGHRRLDNTLIPIADYTCNIYLFGVLIHSVYVMGLTKELANEMFGDKIIEIKNK